MDVILRGRLASEGDDVFTKSANFTALCEMTWACDFKSVIMAFKVGSSFQGTPTNPTFPRRSTRVSTMASMYCKVACNDFRNFSMVPAAARTSPKKDHGLHSTQATPSSLTRRIVHLTKAKGRRECSRCSRRRDSCVHLPQCLGPSGNNRDGQQGLSALQSFARSIFKPQERWFEGESLSIVLH